MLKKAAMQPLCLTDVIGDVIPVQDVDARLLQ